MKKKITQHINDPYGLQRFAPYGLEFLLASDVSSYKEQFIKQKNAFLKFQKSYLKNLNLDYSFAYADSFKLSKGAVEFNDSLSEALFKRQSDQNLVKSYCTFDQLSFLLKLSCGFKNKSDPKSKRMFPSGGALYSTRVYVDVLDVKNIPQGIYLFNPFRETLDLVNNTATNEQRLRLRNGGINAGELENTSFQIFITIKPQITVTKYGEHGLKIALIEVGHLAQNLLLVSTGCGMSSYPNSAISLKQTKKMLRTDPSGEFLVYSIVFS